MKEDGPKPDAGRGGESAPAGDGSSPSSAADLTALQEQLQGAVEDVGASHLDRAAAYAAVEGSLLELLPRLAREDPTFDGVRGHPTLADASEWRKAARRLEVTGQEAHAQGLIDDLMEDELEEWRVRSHRAAHVGDPVRCFQILSESTPLLREGYTRECEMSSIKEERVALREALAAGVAAHPPSSERRAAWATELLDRADVVLTAIDDMPPRVAARHLALVSRDLEWHADVIEQKGRWHRRLARKSRRLSDELQERDLQARLETRFGTRNVARFERTVLFLIFFVLAALTVELAFELSVRARMALAIADTLACVVFLTDFFVKLSMVRGKARWFWRHWFIDLLPSLPFGLLVLAELQAHDAVKGTRFGRALRFVRIFRVARYLRWLVPVLRLVRGFGFLARGLDRLVARFGHLLNQNVVLYPTHEERQQASAKRRPLVREARHVRSRLNREWEELLLEAEAETRPAIVGVRLDALRQAREAGHCRRRREEDIPEDLAEDVPAEVFIEQLGRLTPEEIEAELGQEFVQRVARAVRLFARPPIRWFPVIRKYVPRLAPNMSEAEVVAEAGHSAARQLRRNHERWFWFADLHGTVTPSQFVDRVGTAMVKGSLRPAYRLVLFGGVFLIVDFLLQNSPNETLRDINAFFEKFVGSTLVVLGSVCLVILGVGWWLRRLAGEATFFFEQSAKAQFLNLTEVIKGRGLPQDAALLEQRVLKPEARCLRAAGRDIPRDADGLLEQGVRSWLVETQRRHDAGDLGEALQRVILLYRDGLDGALLGDSDTRTTVQLLGNPAVRQLLSYSERVRKSERKHLRALDLDGNRVALRGPHFWVSLVSRAVAHGAARLIVEYNRHAIPLHELPFATDEEQARYRGWLQRDELDEEIRNEEPQEVRRYVTTSFTALHFLDDESGQEEEIAERFGPEVLAKMRIDRRKLFRQVLGTYPLHIRPREQRVFNLYRLYAHWFSAGRAFLLPLRMIWEGIRFFGRFLAWLVRAISEIRRPQVRRSTRAAAEADFHTAIRKINRMRGPILWASMWLRARFDVEYLGLPVPGLEKPPHRAIQADLRFLCADPDQWRQISHERERAEWDLRRIQRMLDDGLLDQLGERIGVSRETLDVECVRALVALYRADVMQVRTHLSCVDILREMAVEARQQPLRPRVIWPRPFLRRRFLRWWSVAGEGGSEAQGATWRALVHGHHQGRQALALHHKLGPAGAREEGMVRLADALRHVGRVSEQLVSLRAIQTLALIDMRNYRTHVYRLGGYADDGDSPRDWLALGDAPRPRA